MLNLFYEEPDTDRWLPLDRYPRRIVRRITRGRPKVGGQQRMFLNLCAGLDRLGVGYRVNDYRFARRHPAERVGVVGKPHVLDKMPWRNPIVFGAAVFSHPTDDPSLFTRLPIRRVLVPGEWMRRMCEPYWGDRVSAWPVGIDTDRWSDASAGPKPIDVLIYDKIMWRRDEVVPALLEQVRAHVQRAGLRSAELRYGFYQEAEFHRLVGESRSMIFLCEHETQGIAYQQALARNTPVLAWDRGGDWPDPSYYPKIRFGPVSSVPCWDDRCGLRFPEVTSFPAAFEAFWAAVQGGCFEPRAFVLDHLTLEVCARRYVELYEA